MTDLPRTFTQPKITLHLKSPRCLDKTQLSTKKFGGFSYEKLFFKQIKVEVTEVVSIPRSCVV